MPSGCQPVGSGMTSGNDDFAKAVVTVAAAAMVVSNSKRRMGSPFSSLRASYPVSGLRSPERWEAASGFGRGQSRPVAMGGAILQDARACDRRRRRRARPRERSRVKPAKEVRVGDRLEITSAATRRDVVVRGVATKRGPASVAATLYEETPESIARREQQRLERRLARPLGADLGARPTKRDKRRLDALRRASRRGTRG